MLWWPLLPFSCAQGNICLCFPNSATYPAGNPSLVDVFSNGCSQLSLSISASFLSSFVLLDCSSTNTQAPLTDQGQTSGSHSFLPHSGCEVQSPSALLLLCLSHQRSHPTESGATPLMSVSASCSYCQLPLSSFLSSSHLDFPEAIYSIPHALPSISPSGAYITAYLCSKSSMASHYVHIEMSLLHTKHSLNSDLQLHSAFPCPNLLHSCQSDLLATHRSHTFLPLSLCYLSPSLHLIMHKSQSLLGTAGQVQKRKVNK